MSLKRLMDLLLSFVGLILLIPLFLFVSILIKGEDRGPVFYRQRRVGYRGRPFYMWKFRTMIVEADRSGLFLTPSHDPRKTKIGTWLRRYKMDELPQLINVLKGEMSLVGPRPEVEKYVNFYTEAQRAVLEIMPGITDPASLEYRREEELLYNCKDPEKLYIEEIMPKKIQINLNYHQEAMLRRDLLVILRSLFLIFK